MANYKIVDMEWLEPQLTDCANILREKTGKPETEKIDFPEEFKSIIDLLSLDSGSDSGSQYYESSLDLRGLSSTVSCEFNVGFKPRLFLIVTVNSLTVTNSTYYVGAFWHAEYITGVGEYSAGFAINNTTTSPAYNGTTHYSYSNGIVRVRDPATEDKNKHWFMGGKLYRVFAMA